MRRYGRGATVAWKSIGRVTTAVAALLAVVGGGVLLVVPAEVAGASGILPPTNPPVNIPPQVMPHCSISPVDDTSAACINSVLHNINYGRSLEGLGSMVLPSDYPGDSVAEQQLIVTDEERGDRGLTKYSGLDASLNTAAQSGAQSNSDPAPPSGFVAPWGSIFALDYTPLGADFAWMYNDGYGGTNAECTSAGSHGCWGHRDNILGPWASTGGATAEMGDR